VLESTGSGEGALTVAPTFQPDLILLDIMMPGINGYETCRRLRATPALSWTKIIMVSAKAMVSERLQGYEAGADDYVTKPFDDEELLAKVRIHLRLKSIEEVDALKSAFLGLLQHETRTPLTGILGAADLLLEDEEMDAVGRQQLVRTIRRSALRLHDLLIKVVTLAELKSGARTFTVSPLDVRTAIRDALAKVVSQAAEKEVALETPRLEAGSALVDGAAVRTAFHTILDNAIRVSPPGGTVVVDVSREADVVRVAVTDRGPGISPDFLPRVFDEFTTTDLAHHHDGAGLSLAIARRIIEALGGRIGVESRPGSGSTFTVDLPFAATGGIS
jgi:signal transduction histidine kinase